MIPDVHTRPHLECRLVYDKSKDGGHRPLHGSPVPRYHDHPAWWFARERPPRVEHILVGMWAHFGRWPSLVACASGVCRTSRSSRMLDIAHRGGHKGNPFACRTFLDEDYNGRLAKVAKGCHRLTWHRRLVATSRWAHSHVNKFARIATCSSKEVVQVSSIIFIDHFATQTLAPTQILRTRRLRQDTHHSAVTHTH